MKVDSETEVAHFLVRPVSRRLSFDRCRRGRRGRCRCCGIFGCLFGQGTGEVNATRESIIGVFGQRSSQHMVERGKFWSRVGQCSGVLC